MRVLTEHCKQVQCAHKVAAHEIPEPLELYATVFQALDGGDVISKWISVVVEVMGLEALQRHGYSLRFRLPCFSNARR
jgi:hypothetical protein